MAHGPTPTDPIPGGNIPTEIPPGQIPDEQPDIGPTGPRTPYPVNARNELPENALLRLNAHQRRPGAAACRW